MRHYTCAQPRDQLLFLFQVSDVVRRDVAVQVRELMFDLRQIGVSEVEIATAVLDLNREHCRSGYLWLNFQRETLFPSHG